MRPIASSHAKSLERRARAGAAVLGAGAAALCVAAEVNAAVVAGVARSLGVTVLGTSLSLSCASRLAVALFTWSTNFSSGVAADMLGAVVVSDVADALGTMAPTKTSGTTKESSVVFSLWISLLTAFSNATVAEAAAELTAGSIAESIAALATDSVTCGSLLPKSISGPFCELE